MIIYLCIISCQYEYSLSNVLNIQMHLTCRKYRIHNRLQEKKNEDLFQRTTDDSSKKHLQLIEVKSHDMHNHVCK